MNTLWQQTLRLAHDNEDLRPVLVPLLRKVAFRFNTPAEAANTIALTRTYMTWAQDDLEKSTKLLKDKGAILDEVLKRKEQLREWGWDDKAFGAIFRWRKDISAIEHELAHMGEVVEKAAKIPPSVKPFLKRR